MCIRDRVNLSYSPGCKHFCLPDNTFDGRIPASSPGKRDGTIGAEIITAILNFEKTPGTVAERGSRLKICDLFEGATMDFAEGVLIQVFKVFGDVEFIV